SIESIEMPDLSAFRVVGRSTSSSPQFTFSFGGRTQSFQTTSIQGFTLVPERAGTFPIGAATVRVDGRQYKSNTLKIVVRPASGRPSGGPTQGAAPGQGIDDTFDPFGPDTVEPDPRTTTLPAHVVDRTAFLYTDVSNRTPYVGEQVTVDVYFCSRYPLRATPEITTEPSTNGFWVQDLLPPDRSVEAERVSVNGTPYYRYRLKHLAAFPLDTGTATVGAMKLNAEIGNGGFFGLSSRSLTRASEPVKVEARAIPASAAAGGTVVTGDYRLNAAIDRSTLSVGDAATYTVTIEGTGNLRDVHLKLAPQPGLKVFDPEINDHLELQGDKVGGTRTFRWILVPEAPGEYLVTTEPLVVFDPASGAARTVEPDRATVHVTGEARPSPSAPIAADNDTAAPKEAEGLGAIMPKATLRRRTPRLPERSWFAWALVAPPALWLAFLGVGWWGQRRRLLRARGAPALRAARGLRDAETHAQAGRTSAFYASMSTALRGELELRLGEPTGGWTFPALRAHLVERGMDTDLATRLVNELEGFEFARFSMEGSTPDELERCLARVRALVARLERFDPGFDEAAPADEEDA
ncbi:MAG: BatD family protein, partial [Myxococcales bacterium]|nr:BatD family protein [Myxococcales bacterium]